MAILVTAGRIALAIAFKAQPLHMAWGTGDAGWDATMVAEPVTATALVAELGRRALNTCEYVVPDSGGLIVLPSGSWTVSGTPTNNLHCKAIFDYTDASTAIIRELGLFLGTVVSGSVPGTQYYFQPGDLTNVGTLVALQRFSKIIRSSALRQSFEFVITF